MAAPAMVEVGMGCSLSPGLLQGPIYPVPLIKMESVSSQLFHYLLYLPVVHVFYQIEL